MELYSKGIIENVTMQEVGLPNQTRVQKNGVLLLAVSSRVEARPSFFHHFVDILKGNDDDILRQLGGKLEDTYCELHVLVLGYFNQ